MKYILSLVWFAFFNIAMFGAFLFIIENQLSEKRINLLPKFMIKWAQWIVDRI